MQPKIISFGPVVGVHAVSMNSPRPVEIKVCDT